MKKFLLAVLAVLSLVSSAIASPVIGQPSAVYTDDNSAVADFAAIQPYRNVRFTYPVTYSGASITYNGSIMTGSRTYNFTGQVTGTPFKVLIDEDFFSYETGTISLTIIGSRGDGSATIKTPITVAYGEKPMISVTGINLKRDFFTEPANEISATLKREGEMFLRPEAIIYPDNADNKTVEWSSDNEIVATVDQTGLITANYNGEATITVKTVDGGFTAMCKITVTSNGVSSISLTPSSLVLGINKTEEIRITETPAPWQETDWSVKDTSIAEVISNLGYSCLVQGKALGTTELVLSMISITGEPIQATCKITVDEDGSTDDADIAAAKAAIEGAAYTATQAEVSSITEARNKVTSIINGLGVSCTVSLNDGTFTPAVAGTSDNTIGTDGSYTFTATLNKGVGAEQTTAEKTLTITATAYEEGPRAPEDSSGGCNAGFGSVALLLALALWSARGRRIWRR